jgi:catechol 2,3-dioxygenase
MSPTRSIEQVILTVRDLAVMAAFYEKAIGLRPMGSDQSICHLGVGNRVLLTLRSDPAALPHDPGQAGLYHTAFLLPSRTDLSRWLRFAADIGLRLRGASDHGVSEALYLQDPEGNGIEMYRDRPKGDWLHEGTNVRLTTSRLDLEELAAIGTDHWQGAALATTIGHVHLQVGDAEIAHEFFTRQLGLTLTCSATDAGWYGWNGYHHHIAGSAWHSRGAGQRPAGMAGLAEIVISAPDITGTILTDPWGTTFRMV